MPGSLLDEAAPLHVLYYDRDGCIGCACDAEDILNNTCALVWKYGMKAAFIPL